MSRKRIVIVGGSIAGLGAALALAREGHRVTVLEADAISDPPSPEAAFADWDRRGSPQTRHSHAFLARLRNLLLDREPDFLKALLEAGAEPLRLTDMLTPALDDPTPKPGDERIVMLALRRITFEWVLRRLAAERDGITLRQPARVTSLIADRDSSSGLPRVTGVRIEGAGELAADLVIDASGRRSKLGRWLEEIGAAPLEEVSSPCGIYYCSRFYRLREGLERPPREGGMGGDLGYVKFGVFPGDARSFSITLAAAPDDDPMRAIVRRRGFEIVAEALPMTRAWIERADPISHVHAMANLQNTRRFQVRDGEPLALGVIAIGDAAMHANPQYGRGCTVGMLHGFLLADALREHPTDARAAALALEAATERELVPWFDLTVKNDNDAIWAYEAQRRGEDPFEVPTSGPVDPRTYTRALVRHGLVPALRTHAAVLRAFMRELNMLGTPGSSLREPEVLKIVLDAYARRSDRDDLPPGPRRSEMLERLAA
ncbi:MAG: FAD-dependent oxidoreductase [Myxococcota bacterium]